MRRRWGQRHSVPSSSASGEHLAASAVRAGCRRRRHRAPHPGSRRQRRWTAVAAAAC
eukprot:jgi/Chrpa1/5633/Chrysochromulina_OHIO_Genome00014830-RA